MILSSRDLGSRSDGQAFSTSRSYVCLTDRYRSLNHFVLNLSGATGARFDTEGSSLWLVSCGSPEMLFESPGP